MKIGSYEIDKKWASFGFLILGSGSIFKLVSLKDAFYIPMQEFMGLTHLQIGSAISIAGLISTFGFLASIYLTDRISKKIMLPLALLGIALCGVWLSTFPSYPVFLLIYCLLAICADMLYWPTMLKTARLLANKDNQGRIFGIMEAGRGVADLIIAFGSLGVFYLFDESAFGLKMAILFLAAVPGVIGVAMYFLLEDDTNTTESSTESNIKSPTESSPQKAQSANAKALSGALSAIKNKNIWLVSFNIFFVYCMYAGLTYFIPFLGLAYALPVALVGVYGIINQYGLKLVAGPVAGYLADKLCHSPTKYMRYTFMLSAIVLIIFAFLPHKELGIITGMCITLSIVACVFSMRAVFFAPMDEVDVPREITGAAMSMGAFIGYLPGAFMYAIYGSVLDYYKSLGDELGGYTIVFLIMAACAICGFLLSTYIIQSVLKKPNARSL